MIISRRITRAHGTFAGMETRRRETDFTRDPPEDSRTTCYERRRSSRRPNTSGAHTTLFNSVRNRTRGGLVRVTEKINENNIYIE